MGGVSRRDRRPTYQRIADDLLSQITTGRYATGDKLPSLHELCDIYGVSKVTASSALAVLDQQGFIAVHHGLRAVVLPPPTPDDDDDVVQINQHVSAMTRRQEQIVMQVTSLENALRGMQQLVHQLQQQVHQLLQQDNAPQQPPGSQPDSPDPSDD
jgi:DNA-binding GntR family transcriptional regulator